MNKIKIILKTFRVLYAEDNPTTRENISKTLSLLVGEVVSAADGKQALELFQEQSFQIVILDYLMPFMDGVEVARSIRSIDKNIPIIILSSYTDKEKLLSSIKVGITEYLEKPTNFSQLYTSLESATQSIIDSKKITHHLGADVIYNYLDKTIQYSQHIEQLTKNEYTLLEILLDAPHSLFTKTEIEGQIFNDEVEENTLRNLIYRLRKKIPVDVILTIKYQGYMFCPEQ